MKRKGKSVLLFPSGFMIREDLPDSSSKSGRNADSSFAMDVGLNPRHVVWCEDRYWNNVTIVNDTVLRSLGSHRAVLKYPKGSNHHWNPSYLPPSLLLSAAMEWKYRNKSRNNLKILQLCDFLQSRLYMWISLFHRRWQRNIRTINTEKCLKPLVTI